MGNDRRKFTREPASQRKDALIRATLALIGEAGVAAATVRAIAERAEVTQGLIRHHFTSKEDLINAAYGRHMSNLTETTFASSQAAESPVARLRAFVTASLTPPVVDPAALTLWAGFLNMVRSDARMQETHERTYRDFRDRLEAMIGDSLRHAGHDPSPRELRQKAIACNAVIDGLWLEGGALPTAFEPGELPEIGLGSVSAIIGIDLNNEAQQP